MIQKRPALILAWTLTVMIAACIAFLYNRTKLIPQGSTDVFWTQLFEKSGNYGWSEEVYEFEGEYFYSKQYMPILMVFQVDAAAVERELPDNAAWLREYSLQHPDSWQASGYEAWTHVTEFVSTESGQDDDDAPSSRPSTAPTTSPTSHNGLIPLPGRNYKSPEPPPRPEPKPVTRPARPSEMTLGGLIDKLRDAKDQALCRHGVSARWRGQADQWVWQHIADNRFHWAAAVFEFVFLSGLVWFLIWPSTQRQSPFFTALRYGVAPTLFFLPIYFGYIPIIGFSGNGVFAYPSGGILYPRLALLMKILFVITINPSMSDAEAHIVSYVPKILGPLAGGFPDAHTYDFNRGPSFLSLLVADLVVFTTVYILLKILKATKTKLTSSPQTPHP